MDQMTKAFALPILLIGLSLAACNKKENAEQPGNDVTQAQAASPLTSAPIDPATAAVIRGTVKFDGIPPKPREIDMSQDPACKGSNQAETIVVENGALANVFVYMKAGLGNRTFEIPKEPALLEQRGCKYHPHVLGLMAGQTLDIKNEDMTNHNIHPSPQNNREWNESQPPSSPTLEKRFAREEIMLPVKCNQHPWMKMYINVVKNPFFAVTDKAGKYEIKGLPPGDYTIAFVQEKLGERDQQVTVGPKETKTVDQSFKAASE